MLNEAIPTWYETSVGSSRARLVLLWWVLCRRTLLGTMVVKISQRQPGYYSVRACARQGIGNSTWHGSTWYKLMCVREEDSKVFRGSIERMEINGEMYTHNKRNVQFRLTVSLNKKRNGARQERPSGGRENTQRDGKIA